MAVPLNLWVQPPVPSAYVPPLDDDYKPLTMRCLGGVAIGDGSQGRETQIWTVSYVDPVITITPTTTGSAITLNVAGIKTICLAFDSNMQPSLSYMKADGGYLYFFSSLTNTFVTNYYPTITSCRICVDKSTAFFNAFSDVIFGYISDTLHYRIQRDRYNIEYTPGGPTAINTLVRWGPSEQNRLQAMTSVVL